MTKLLSEVTGKAAEETNLINIVQDIIAGKKWLKDIVKSIKKTYDNDNLTAKTPEEEIYICEKCDFEFDEEDALETHHELYHEN